MPISLPARLTGCLVAPLAAVLLLSPGPASGASDPRGLWLTEGKSALLAISSCGRRLCGRIVWLEEPRDGGGRLRVDYRNLDPAKQSRAICGLTVINSLRDTGNGTWKGYIYSPRDGKTYSGNLKVLSPDTLRVRAYSVFSLRGDSQTWTRYGGPPDSWPDCRDGSLQAERPAPIGKAPATDVTFPRAPVR